MSVCDNCRKPDSDEISVRRVGEVDLCQWCRDGLGGTELANVVGWLRKQAAELPTPWVHVSSIADAIERGDYLAKPMHGTEGKP